jgi:uncharacterized protein (TIGR03437 family)
MNYMCIRYLAAILSLIFAALPAAAQRNRITESVRNGRRATLAGHVPSEARAENDQGRAAADLKLRSMSLVLKPSDAQEADLEQLLAAQQDPSSPEYHHWLTPEEYADRFGVSTDDLKKVTDWLTSQGLTVTATARARNSVSFTGTAAQVEKAFATEIHSFLVNGEVHFSNASDPSLPEALTAVVRAVHGLNDFRLKPMRSVKQALPQYTSASGRHYLAPDDVATVYDILPLYSAGYDGAGQKIAVVGQTQVAIADIQQFRTSFGLPANDPQITLVPNLRDPGVSSDDVDEANLDIQWTGAIARNATIVYVYSYNVMDAVQYTIDQNLAPVLSMSYGLCEAQTARSDAAVLQSWARQANAQGMTWISASGDSGGADCATTGSNGGYLSVDLPAAIPEVTGMGGTEFNEGTGSYWNASNNATKSSVISYIPETVWNDGTSSDGPSAGGGGASTIFAKPTWQSGLGVPADGARDVPDISLASSAQHDGYLMYSGGQLSAVGGTSVAAPVFAGILTLIQQRVGASGSGNINPKLYALAQSTPGAFHDIISGDNKATITCGLRSRNCLSGSYGFDAGPGYDQASGLGSVDAYQLALAWGAAAARSTSPGITSLANGASFLQAFAPGMVMSVFGSQLAPASAAAASVPLPTQLSNVTATVNGVAAPLYYVSPAQVNLQVPAQLQAGSAVLVISNNGQTASANFTLSAAAPGIFTDSSGSAVPFRSAKRGDTITLYVTGTASLPVSVTVGGVAATITYVATPQALQGVVQVNYQVPAQAGLGTQPVVVTAGGVSSPSANLLVTQ